MKTTVIWIAVILSLAAAINLGGCNSRNVPPIKAVAEQRYKEMGYTVFGYEGYRVGDIGETPGGQVWYTVKGPDGVVYISALRMWNGEVQLWYIRPLNPTTQVRN